MERAVLCRTNPENSEAQGQSGLYPGQGGRFHSFCPRAAAFTSFLPALGHAAGGGPGGCRPTLPTQSCSSQTLYNAPSHSSSSACDRPGAAERALRVWGRGDFQECGRVSCSAPCIIIRGGFSWSRCQAAPYPTSADLVASAASRTGGGGRTQLGRAHRLQALPRPEGGSSRWLDA